MNATVYLKGTDCSWLATDSDGRVALLATAGGGVAPKALLTLRDHYKSALCLCDGLPKCGDVGQLSDPESSLEWMDEIRQGLYVYDSDFSGSPYRRIGAPTVPLHVDALPSALSSIAKLVVFEQLRFEEQGVLLEGSILEAQNCSAAKAAYQLLKSTPVQVTREDLEGTDILWFATDSDGALAAFQGRKGYAPDAVVQDRARYYEALDGILGLDSSTAGPSSSASAHPGYGPGQFGERGVFLFVADDEPVIESLEDLRRRRETKILPYKKLVFPGDPLPCSSLRSAEWVDLVRLVTFQGLRFAEVAELSDKDISAAEAK